MRLPGVDADAKPSDFAVVFGGGFCPDENPAQVGLADAFTGQGPEPGASDLWVGPVMPSAAGQTASAENPSLKPFHRAVLAFPPKPRRGFSLTPLDASGRRLLFFGGHDGRSCLNDLQILEFPANAGSSEAPHTAGAAASAEISVSDEESEPEEIFFASDYRSQVKMRSKPQKAGKTAAPPTSWPKGAVPPPMLPTTRSSQDSDGSDGSDSDSSEASVRQERAASHRFAPTSGRQVLPCNLQSVLSTLGNSSKVKHTKMEAEGIETGDRKSVV